MICQSSRSCISKFVMSAVGALFALIAPAVAGEMWLSTNAPKLMTFDKPIGSLLISDPAVADVTVQSNTEILFFGKMPGVTNIYVFDEAGVKTQTLSVRVKTNRRDMLTLQSGGTQYSFSCTDVCEQVPAIGDGSNESRAELGTVATQALTRFTRASQSGNPSTASTTRAGNPDEEVDDTEEYNEDAGDQTTEG